MSVWIKTGIVPVFAHVIVSYSNLFSLKMSVKAIFTPVIFSFSCFYDKARLSFSPILTFFNGNFYWGLKGAISLTCFFSPKFRLQFLVQFFSLTISLLFYSNWPAMKLKMLMQTDFLLFFFPTLSSKPISFKLMFIVHYISFSILGITFRFSCAFNTLIRGSFDWNFDYTFESQQFFKQS